jgi:Flp pilus assembly protein CpaB
MTLKHNGCIICNVPSLVILSVLLAAAAAGGVLAWRIEKIEAVESIQESRIRQTESALGELVYIRAALARIEARLDRSEK